MRLDKCICYNMFDFAIYKSLKALNGILECVFNWLIKYLSIIGEIYDIVFRAVEAKIREYTPTARTNKEKIEYRRIRFFEVVMNNNNIAIAIARQKSSSAVVILHCYFLSNTKGGDVYD